MTESIILENIIAYLHLVTLLKCKVVVKKPNRDIKFSSRLLPANFGDCSLLGFSVSFVLYYFDVALLMSCEMSCAEHSVP